MKSAILFITSFVSNKSNSYKSMIAILLAKPKGFVRLHKLCAFRNPKILNYSVQT